MRSAVFSGCAYFALIFAIGFLLGTLRVLVLSPHIGDVLAVLAELPVMLAADLLDDWSLNDIGVSRFGLIIAAEMDARNTLR